MAVMLDIVELGQVALFMIWIVEYAGVGGGVGGWALFISGKAIPKAEIIPNPKRIPKSSL
jgi:hypothetical protein